MVHPRMLARWKNIKLPPRPRVRYTRKSTTKDDRQAQSHEQQNEVMDLLWGQVDKCLYWKDSHTGTTFDRPDYRDLQAFCEANPQPANAPGIVEIYDPSRFGRPLTSAGESDIMAFLDELNRFDRVGWKILFTNVVLTGNSFADAVMMVAHAYIAAEYSAKLMRDVRRGKHDWARKGGWIHGQPPYPTKRFDPDAGRILEPGELARAGAGGTILIITDADLRRWVRGARMVLDGHSLDSIGAEWHAQGLRGPRGGRWGHKQVRNTLTNRALIGLVEYHHHHSQDGSGQFEIFKAKWEPLVPVDLFHAVVAALASRAETPSGRSRKRREEYPLAGVIQCAGCGATYDGGRRSQAQGRGRCYVHPTIRARMNPDRYEMYRAAGCKRWTILAEDIETKIKDLILAERASPDYEEHLRRMLVDRDTAHSQAAVRGQEAAKEVRNLTEQRSAVARLQMEAAKRKVDSADYWNEIDRLNQSIETARKEQEELEAFAKQSAQHWLRLQSVLHETRNLGTIWDSLSVVERKRVLERWVDGILVAVEPISGMRRANRKFGIIYLESAPGIPRAVSLGDEALEPSCKAHSSSSRTHSSSSASSLPRTACSAPSDAILPSAQAACPRISGSSSERAAASTGTASGEPQLPSATATFRSSPRRFARLTGDLRNLAENSSCESDINSTSFSPCTPALGQNASSEVTCTNLKVLKGQTSWVFYRCTGPRTPLNSGRRMRSGSP
jgi:hypothetical protein